VLLYSATNVLHWASGICVTSRQEVNGSAYKGGAMTSNARHTSNTGRRRESMADRVGLMVGVNVLVNIGYDSFDKKWKMNGETWKVKIGYAKSM